MEAEAHKCVHTEHCCVIHGCKYSDESCPVVLRIKDQSYCCESCGEWEEDMVDGLRVPEEFHY